MKNKNIDIIPFQDIHQNDIDDMMVTIASEFSDPIFSSTSKKIKDVAALSTNKYWVASYDHKVIGTIGLGILSNHSIVLKSMFVASDFRRFGLGKLLLNTLEEWCSNNACSTIYLGTMTQFKSGQHFYERNKFQLINQSNLPKDFPINPLDTLFYWKKINESTRLKDSKF